MAKFKTPATTKLTSSQPIPPATGTNNPTMASNMAATSTPSLEKACKSWGLPCLFCAQSTLHPSPVDSDWSKEDWDGDIEREKRMEKERKEEEMKPRQEIEEKEKAILDPKYYLPSPVYVPNYKEETPALVSDLVPNLAPEKTTNTKQNEKENKTKEDRRILLEILDEGNDLDYYLDSD